MYFDSNNVPLNIQTMTDDKIAAQVGIATEYLKVSTFLESDNLNCNIDLALSNSDTTTAQTADFTNSTSKKKVTL